MGIIKSFILNKIRQMRTYFKPYIKGIKLFSFLFIIVFNTFLVIRKKDKLSLNIEESIRSNLPVDKNYLAINNSPFRKLDKADEVKLNLLLSKKNSNLAEIYVFDHKCRINDTLFLVEVFVDRQNNIKALDKPIKFH